MRPATENEIAHARVRKQTFSVQSIEMTEGKPTEVVVSQERTSFDKLLEVIQEFDMAYEIWYIDTPPSLNTPMNWPPPPLGIFTNYLMISFGKSYDYTRTIIDKTNPYTQSLFGLDGSPFARCTSIILPANYRIIKSPSVDLDCIPSWMVLPPALLEVRF